MTRSILRTGLVSFLLNTFCQGFLNQFIVKCRRSSLLMDSASPSATDTSTFTGTPSTHELDGLRYEALSYFIIETKELIKFTPTSGGVNNYMDYVTILSESPNQPKYVLRVYNNGLNSKRVEFEHLVLDEIMKIVSNTGNQLTFDLPIAIKSIKTDSLNPFTGATHVVLSNKAEASLFKYIPGVLPKKSCVKQIGQAAGQLVTIMGQIKINTFPASPNPAYFDIYRAHHAITQDKFYNELTKPVFTQQSDNTKKYMSLLVDELRAIEKFIARMQALNPALPVQLIHGDLHYDNILAFPEQNKVTGLLDFEFSAFDWRAMELAVCLSKYADKPDEAMEIFRQFVDGFSEKGILTEREMDLIPELIILRILSNVVYFMGRAVAGEDNYDALTLRAENYYKRIEWLKNNREEIVQIVKNRMLK